MNQAGIGQAALPLGRAVERFQRALQACLHAEFVAPETCRGRMAVKGALGADAFGGELFGGLCQFSDQRPVQGIVLFRPVQRQGRNTAGVGRELDGFVCGRHGIGLTF